MKKCFMISHMPRSPVENLRIWKHGVALAKNIYEHTKHFPKEEIYGLTSQMRRCAISIPSNIAEGSQRGTDKDFAHFLIIARGSCAELKTQIILSHEFGYLDKQSFDELLVELENIGRQLGSFHTTLSR
jgi:four helix bundle protein